MSFRSALRKVKRALNPKVVTNTESNRAISRRSARLQLQVSTGRPTIAKKIFARNKELMKKHHVDYVGRFPKKGEYLIMEEHNGEVLRTNHTRRTIGQLKKTRRAILRRKNKK